MQLYVRCSFLLLVTLVSPFAFTQSQSKAPPSAGASVYADNCALCHGPEGKGGIGPSLETARDAGQIMAIVRTGKGAMPAFAPQLSAEQIGEVADYVRQKLATVSLTGGSLSEGGVLYRVNCAPCHRTDVRGGALAFANGNAPKLTGLSPETIAGAVRSGPGAMPSFPPSVFDQKQLASIVSYVRFMQHPPNPGGLPLNYYGPVSEGLVALVMVGILAVIGWWIEERGRG